jgi:DNA-binding NarL/FixJ family response regulator
MINILLCDDHEIVRKGLRQLLQEQPGFFVMADVPSGEALLKELRKVKPDVVILDIALPGRSGLEVLKQLRLLYPEIKVLALSMYPEDQFAIRLIKAGASGYLHKDSAPAMLNEAIRTIAKGGKFVSPRMMSVLFHEVANEKRHEPLHKMLSDREFEVLLMLAQGKKVGEISAAMSLSIKTVSTYKTRILEKLKLNSIAALTRYVDENHLLQHASPG